MITYEYEIKGLDEQLARLKGYEKIADAELTKAMNQSTLTILAHVKPLVPVGVSGQLRNSMSARVTSDGMGSVVGKVGSNLTNEVYPSVMEHGRRPGKMPPPSALERWVRLKMRVPAKDVKGVAFVVARNIGRRGIKGKKFLQRGYDQSKPRVYAYFQQALDRITERLAGGGN